MKKFGIRVTLPKTDFLSSPHLLGESFESFRWYDDEHARDEAYELMNRHLPNYRTHDIASQVLEKVEK